MLKSRLFKESSLFKGQRVQQSSQQLLFFVLIVKDYFVQNVKKKLKTRQNNSTIGILYEKIHKPNWRPCTHTFSSTVVNAHSQFATNSCYIFNFLSCFSCHVIITLELYCASPICATAVCHVVNTPKLYYACSVCR